MVGFYTTSNLAILVVQFCWILFVIHLAGPVLVTQGVTLGNSTFTVPAQHHPSVCFSDRVGGNWRGYWVWHQPLHVPPLVCPLRQFDACSSGGACHHRTWCRGSHVTMSVRCPSLFAPPLLPLPRLPLTAFSGVSLRMRGSLWASWIRRLHPGDDVLPVGTQLYTAAAGSFIQACLFCWGFYMLTAVSPADSC